MRPTAAAGRCREMDWARARRGTSAARGETGGGVREPRAGLCRRTEKNRDRKCMRAVISVLARLQANDFLLIIFRLLDIAADNPHPADSFLVLLLARLLTTGLRRFRMPLLWIRIRIVSLRQHIRRLTHCMTRPSYRRASQIPRNADCCQDAHRDDARSRRWARENIEEQRRRGQQCKWWRRSRRHVGKPRGGRRRQRRCRRRRWRWKRWRWWRRQWRWGLRRWRPW